MNRSQRSPRILAWACVTAIGAMPAWCWDPPTCTIQTTPSKPSADGTCLLGHTCSGWRWVDPSGVTHAFPGTSSNNLRMKAISRWGLVPVNGDVEASREIVDLKQVQASDGAPVFLSTTQGKVGSVITKSSVYPKYKVLSVIYAPPGNGSSVTYGVGSSVGTVSTVSHAFNWEIGLTAEVEKQSLGLGYAQGKTSEHALAITCTDTASKSWYSALDGIDHDQDVVEIWLNPAVEYSFANPGEATWTLVNNPGDPITATIGADVVTLTVGQLMGRAPITNEYQLARLRRDWPGGGALTGPGEGTDFHAIAMHNPYCAHANDFAANAFIPEPERFTLAKATKVNYAPNQGPMQMFTYSVGKETVNSQSRTFAKNHTVQASIGASFCGFLGLTGSGSMTWTDRLEDRDSKGESKNAQLTIVQPPSDWQGPTEVVVYTDNLYGTFLFTYLK